MKKPTSVIRRRAWVFLFDLSGRFSSGHGSPPAWMFHDDGGGRDGGGSASAFKGTGKALLVSNGLLLPARKRAENE
jgi:hypothetical protein